MAPAMRIVFGLLTFVTVGMIIGALLQLAFINRLEDSYGTGFPSIRGLRGQSARYLRDVSRWSNDKDAEILRLGYVKPEVVNWSPRIIVLHNFLSSEECEYLKAIARPRLQVSTVVDIKTGKGVKSDVRTSSGMFLTHVERSYPMIQAIEKRIAVFSQVPAENGELIQVLRYEPKQFYRPHHDYFADTFNLKRGGQRVATMLMYLTDDVEGGETYFPLAGDGECTCGGKIMKGISVKPTKGDAVLFWSMGLDGQSDPKSIHGGCEVLSGEKWSATKCKPQTMAASLQSVNPTLSRTLASPNRSPSFRSPILRFDSASAAFNFKPLVSRNASSAFITRSAAEPQERKTFHGLCYVVGDNIDTDQIIPAEFLTLVPSNPDEYEKLGSYALIGLPAAYKERFVQPGEMKTKYSIIIGGENFGCGSSREHAPVCLGAAGAKAVVAQSYARIFFRNSVATGEIYPLDSEVRVCDECKTGDVATVELREGDSVLINHTTGKEYKLKAIGDAGPVIDAGGIFAYARKAGMIPSAAA